MLTPEPPYSSASRPGLSAAMDAVFEARQLLDADRPARMKLAGGNPDLGAEAELAAIGELRRGVMQHDRGIHLIEEFLSRRRILGHDGVGVMRAVLVDMRDRSIDAGDHFGGDDRIEIFRAPIVIAGRLHTCID